MMRLPANSCSARQAFWQVNQELKQVRGLVTGVPYFVFNKGQGDQEVHISGAQVSIQWQLADTRFRCMPAEFRAGLCVYRLTLDG